jgi:hypothetical protein
MDSIGDFGSSGVGSNPTRGTNIVDQIVLGLLNIFR